MPRGNHNTLSPRWTESEDDYLHKHWRKQSARDIAAKIGRQRSAVLGRARRLGLSKSPAENEPVGWQAAPDRPQPSLPKLAFMGER